jgi:hypothetical protein
MRAFSASSKSSDAFLPGGDSQGLQASRITAVGAIAQSAEGVARRSKLGSALISLVIIRQ